MSHKCKTFCRSPMQQVLSQIHNLHGQIHIQLALHKSLTWLLIYCTYCNHNATFHPYTGYQSFHKLFNSTHKCIVSLPWNSASSCSLNLSSERSRSTSRSSSASLRVFSSVCCSIAFNACCFCRLNSACAWLYFSLRIFICPSLAYWALCNFVSYHT